YSKYPSPGVFVTPSGAEGLRVKGGVMNQASMTGGHYSVVRVLTAALAWAALGLPGALPALLLGFGLFDAAAAAALSVLMMATSPAWPSDARLLAVLVLALHMALPNKPWGALATRGES